MRPVNWKELREICRRLGWEHTRTTGDHYIMNKPGAVRPVVFMKVKDLGDNIVQGVRRTLGITRREFDALLDEARGIKKRKPEG